MSTLVATVKRTIGITEGQSIIWWLIGWQKSLQFQLCIALPGFFILFNRVFGDPVSAVVMLFSMLAHEVGHALVFILSKIRVMVRLLFPLGAAAIPATPEEDKKSDQLPWFIISWLTLAGIIFNLGLVVVGRILTGTADAFLSEVGAKFVSLNMFLILFNIIPVWKTDAALFFSSIFSSLDEKGDRNITVFLATTLSVAIFVLAVHVAVPGIAGVFLDIITNFGKYIFVLALVAGIWHQNRIDKPEYATSSQRMTHSQAIGMSIVFCAIALSTIALGK